MRIFQHFQHISLRRRKRKGKRFAKFVTYKKKKKKKERESEGEKEERSKEIETFIPANCPNATQRASVIYRVSVHSRGGGFERGED